MSSSVPGRSVRVASIAPVFKERRRVFSLFPLVVAGVGVGSGSPLGGVSLHGRNIPLSINWGGGGELRVAGPKGVRPQRGSGEGWGGG